MKSEILNDYKHSAPASSFLNSLPSAFQRYSLNPGGIRHRATVIFTSSSWGLKVIMVL